MPPSDGLPPGLTYFDNRKEFLNELVLSESIIEIKDEPGALDEQHPFFKHPRFSNLPRMYFRWGQGGYELGLEVYDHWWERLCKGGEIGELGKIQIDNDRLCGTARLVVAKLPYSEFGIYYQNVDFGHLGKQQEARDKQLEVNGWKRRVEEDSPDVPRDPWSDVEHKYFTVSHRSM